MDQSSPASYHSEIDSRRSFGKNMPFAYEEARSETPLSPSSGDFSFIGSDRRFAFARQPSLARSSTDSRSSPSPLYTRSPLGAASPTLPRTGSGIDIPPGFYSGNGYDWLQTDSGMFEKEKTSTKGLGFWVFGNLRGGTRPMRRLLLMILLNVLYSTTELLIGLLSGRVGLVSDAFHLTFGCGLLTFSLFAMAMSRKKPDRVYTYGYKRLEVLAAFTNALFLLFMSFSLAVEALHAFVQDESEHKHYLVVSAVTNLLVNLIGVWFFRGYARLNLVYRNAEDMNNHSVCLHVLADSIRSAGLIMASWLLTIGVENAEVLCMGLVSVTVFVLVRPIFMATGGILLQTAPSSIPSSAMSKCYRQITSREDVSEIYEGRFWELVPGHAVGSISIQVKDEVDDRPILHYTHGLYQDIGVQNLTVQTEYSADAE